METAGDDRGYKVPNAAPDYAGIVLTLARQEHPDTSAYADPEIVTRIRKHHHAGLIVRSTDPKRVQMLLADYADRFQRDFTATMPVPERPGE